MVGVIKILFVCTGNICRSPTADGLMRARVAEAGLSDCIEVDSAGTHGYHVGEPPDRRSIAEARLHNVDISRLRSRQLIEEDFHRSNIIAVMERRHLRHLLDRCPPGREDRLHLLMSFASDAPTEEVPDPYYDDDGFDLVFRMIDDGVRGLLDHVRRTYLSTAAP